MFAAGRMEPGHLLTERWRESGLHQRVTSGRGIRSVSASLPCNWLHRQLQSRVDRRSCVPEMVHGEARRSRGIRRSSRGLTRRTMECGSRFSKNRAIGRLRDCLGRARRGSGSTLPVRSLKSGIRFRRRRLLRNGIKSAIFAALLLPLAIHAQAPTTILSTDLLVNRRSTINSNFSGLYTGRTALVDCSATTGAFVVTLVGGAGPSLCRTLTWSNILALSGTPATFVTSWNSRSGAVSLGQADVAAVEQDLRNTASPNFVGLNLGGNLAVTGTTTLSGGATVTGPVTVTSSGYAFFANQGTAGGYYYTGSGAVIGGDTTGHIAMVLSTADGTCLLRVDTGPECGIESPSYGGTGVANTGTLTLGGNTTFSGAFNPTFSIPSSSTWTFPAAGILIGSNDTGTVTNTMLAGSIAASKVAGTAATLGNPNAFTLLQIAPAWGFGQFTYSTAPICGSGGSPPNANFLSRITDSTVNTWGTTISTGGGSDNVLAFCNGSVYTVAGK